MPDYHGEFAPGATVRFAFPTHTTAGAPTTLSGGALRVYKDASTSQSAAGVTLTADFDSLTGLNHVAIDTSADGTFYAAGSDFFVVLDAGTVDGQSVAGTPVGSFSIANRGPIAANVTQVDGVALTTHTAGMIPAQVLDMDESLVGDPEELAAAVHLLDVTAIEASAPALSLVTSVLGTLEWEIVPGTPPTYRIRKSTGATHAERALDTAAISGSEVVTGTQGPE